MELLLVIAIIGIAALVGVPALLKQLSKVQLEAAASNVANLMNQARQRTIKENKRHAVKVIGDEVHTLRIIDEDLWQANENDPLATDVVFEYQFTDPGAELYLPGVVVCDHATLVYETTGVVEDLGRICLFDGGDNILEVGVLSVAGQPKVRKHLNAADSPTTIAGFFEKPSAATSGVAWTWY